MHGSWRQVRIFSTAPGPGLVWYFEMLDTIVRPWLAQHPDTSYFFSRYAMPLPGDQSDTNFVGLPQSFKIPIQGADWHRSIRIRFFEPTVNRSGQASATGVSTASTPVEDALKILIEADQQRFWKSDFRHFDVGDGLGDLRFSNFTSQQTSERTSRGKLIVDILRANCQLVLDSFKYSPGVVLVEPNSHNENQALGTSFQSVGHMLANVWWDRHAISPKIWAIDPSGKFGMPI